jgi:tetratricopeptide (TPR) repeat protein
MTDPFDQALGVCDECRNKTAEVSNSDSPFPPMPAPPPAASPSSPRPAAVPLFPSASSFPSSEASAMRSAARDTGSSSSGGQSRGRIIGIAAGVLVVVAVGVGLAIKKPWVTKPPPLVVRPVGGGGGKPDSIIQQWRLMYPDLDGKASQFVDEGEDLLAKDTTKGYLDAEESFEQALVLEPNNDRALAGWVLALAFGKPGKIDEPTARAAESMLAAAEQRGDLRVYVAHAHFMIARSGNPNDIRVLAERGANSKSSNDKALSSLAIGQTILTKNPQQAAQSFREALATDPKLKRAYFFQAQLAAIQGNYKEATRALERRLELDADQWEAAEELARLLVDVGELPKAKKVLENAKAAAPRAGRPRLALAMLAYQHLGDLAGAATELQALVDDPEIAKVEKADVLVHLAAIQRIQGDADKASDTIEKSLEFNADSVSAKLQKFLILLDKGIASSARLELDGLKGKLGDKYLEATLEGRLLIAENRLDDAIQILSATAEADPRRVDAIFLAGAAAARAKKAGKAWEFCMRRGLRADPNSRPVPSLTPLFVRPADLLKIAVGAYAKLAPDLDEDPTPSVCEGMVAWFSEDYATADKHFTKATAVDAKNADSYAYRSLIATRRKDVGGGLKLAARGTEANKANALSWLAHAQALWSANKIDQAKVSAQQAKKVGPQLLMPKVIEGDAEASQKNPDEARRILTTVLLADPLFREAKKVLYKHQL